MNEIQQILKNFLQERKIPMKTASLQAGLSEGAIRHLLSGKDVEYPKVNTLKRIADGLGVPFSTFIPDEWIEKRPTTPLIEFFSLLAEVVRDNPDLDQKHIDKYLELTLNRYFDGHRLPTLKEITDSIELLQSVTNPDHLNK